MVLGMCRSSYGGSPAQWLVGMAGKGIISKLGAICRSPCGAVKQSECRVLLSRARVASQPADVGDGPVALSESSAMH